MVFLWMSGRVVSMGFLHPSRRVGLTVMTNARQVIRRYRANTFPGHVGTIIGSLLRLHLVDVLTVRRKRKNGRHRLHLLQRQGANNVIRNSLATINGRAISRASFL